MLVHSLSVLESSGVLWQNKTREVVVVCSWGAAIFVLKMRSCIIFTKKIVNLSFTGGTRATATFELL
jgi:hypothetical protein